MSLVDKVGATLNGWGQNVYANLSVNGKEEAIKFVALLALCKLSTKLTKSTVAGAIVFTVGTLVIKSKLCTSEEALTAAKKELAETQQKLKGLETRLKETAQKADTAAQEVQALERADFAEMKHPPKPIDSPASREAVESLRAEVKRLQQNYTAKGGLRGVIAEFHLRRQRLEMLFCIKSLDADTRAQVFLRHLTSLQESKETLERLCKLQQEKMLAQFQELGTVCENIGILRITQPIQSENTFIACVLESLGSNEALEKTPPEQTKEQLEQERFKLLEEIQKGESELSQMQLDLKTRLEVTDDASWQSDYETRLLKLQEPIDQLFVRCSVISKKMNLLARLTAQAQIFKTVRLDCYIEKFKNEMKHHFNRFSSCEYHVQQQLMQAQSARYPTSPSCGNLMEIAEWKKQLGLSEMQWLMMQKRL